MSRESQTDPASFLWIDDAAGHRDPAALFEELISKFTRERQYGSVFNARLMQTRLALGLPLMSQPTIADVPAPLQAQYQNGYIEAAREVGTLFLANGNIAAAWPYFRAIGDIKPIADAIDAFDAGDTSSPESAERLSTVVQIAFQEGAHPKKGFELMLKHYGMCRAVTMFAAYPETHGREESLQLLVRALHAEIVENLKHAIRSVEDTAPETESIPVLIAHRDWLFEHNAQYTDSSHLVALLKFCGDLEDRAALAQAVELAAYGCRLGAMFQYNDDPPFERGFEDRHVYLRALAGEDVDAAVAHFTAKAEAGAREYGDTRPAEVLVGLLVRLERPGQAIQAFKQFLGNVPPEQLSCPTLLQLCEMAGDFEQLKQVAQQQSDPLSYLAAVIRKHGV